MTIRRVLLLAVAGMTLIAAFTASHAERSKAIGSLQIRVNSPGPRDWLTNHELAHTQLMCLRTLMDYLSFD